MPRFEVLSGSTLVGYSELEAGDPPMGVALGRFIPLLAYDSIKSAVVATSEADQSNLHLSVCLADGSVLPAQGGVQIVDFSAELGPEGLQVHVLGIGYPLYQELFPAHVAAYERQLRTAG
jgi:hypothetical protein